ncbi:hypothetical protein ACFUCV_05620 [Specibacter sp. NPDC057265]|uniref:hypothetical protein n=1 Tax=Specibacter sp. NPDC057265 TaxID=3346075 RepID=UPI003628360E
MAYPLAGGVEGGAAVGVVKTELAALLGILRSAVNPEEVSLVEDEQEQAAVAVQVLALNRVGRSRRAGPVLDLELAVSVVCTGGQRLENLEKLLTSLEGGSRYTTSALNAGAFPQAPGALGFQVHVPVAVPLEEPKAPPVREPLHVKMQTGRQLKGVVIDPAGNGLGGAWVRSRASGAAVACDQQGRFECFSTQEAEQLLTVEFRDTTQQFTANATMLPITLRWDGED